jgi:REP element-mobilizing transposase RayT
VPEWNVVSTCASLHCHIVFSTKDRIPTIEKEWIDDLFRYVAGTVRGLGATSLAVNGISDHVHLLVGLKPTHCVADVVRELKKASSSWVHDHVGYREFAWQEGYAAFAVGPKGVDNVCRYITNQVEHHQKVNSRDELLAMLAEACIEPDMRYFK